MNFFNQLIPQKYRLPFLFLSIAGMLSHFLYEWTGSALLALFCPINESVWEHLKLLFFPFLLYTLWSYLRKSYTDGKHTPYAPAYFYYRLLAVLGGMASIIVLFYTYTGIIGKDILFLDIFIFEISILFTLRLVSFFAKRVIRLPSDITIICLWFALTLCFFLFTCFPPEIPLFFPPA